MLFPAFFLRFFLQLHFTRCKYSNRGIACSFDKTSVKFACWSQVSRPAPAKRNFFSQIFFNISLCLAKSIVAMILLCLKNDKRWLRCPVNINLVHFCAEIAVSLSKFFRSGKVSCSGMSIRLHWYIFPFQMWSAYRHEIMVWKQPLESGCRIQWVAQLFPSSKPVAASKNAPVQIHAFQPHFYIAPWSR